ncbi:MAG TPA: Sjogren's syndrome/scleroderma autoantigen 1 family protein [Methanothrix sp.]|nr:Sjogren's syndrome/scleroderma autoantigen 1 family protein [Methanothrix sp.]HOK58524.1 Sjogren's syndrome/scleroderma autoantigen 1 family protein [Methanothrix sp.]HOL43693.1 Sjogren's syndrome/scleroderma autoantigen 1 family protein [Methanothrix sp.]HPO88749.1 Sjogren's syndrome/scleroderma autoantigen 1 family protein [Methanothrix sp.]
MDEEEMIRRITRMMEIGGTMLAEHHDCGAPLFRYKGEILCPVCSASREAEQDAAVKLPEEKKLDVSEGRISESTAQRSPVSTSVSPATRDEKDALSVVKEMLHAKLRELCEGIAGEQDLSRLKSKLECIEIAIRALNQL